MDIGQLKRLDEAPPNGQMLAYTRKDVLFHAYKNLQEVRKELSGADLLELHLFDHAKEYRCLQSESKRFPCGFVEHTEAFPEDVQESVYIENVVLEGSGNRLRVLNHIRYDEETGAAEIDSYRLVMGG